ncbi:MAG: M48 family peptidase [Betaproteobacteria bacterium]|nr:M48 family peptidase [Betaproteobacteria bacterium]
MPTAKIEKITASQAGAVGVERKQNMLVSSAQVNDSAAKAYQQISQEVASKGQLNRDPQQVARVRTIAYRLIPHTAAFRPDAPGWKWEVNVISSEQINAWCMPGGKIAVYSGILGKLGLTDDEAAAVMGHEMAHALREHSREQVSQKMEQGIAVGVIGAALGIGGLAQDVTRMLLDVTFNLPNSRTAETEADRIGVELAARAGYDPHAAIGLWHKMSKQSGSEPPKWLSTHPENSARIKDLEVYAERVHPLYLASKKK